MSFLHVSTPIIERLGWTLVHSVWQLALVAGLAMVLNRLTCRATASTRYVMLVAMFLILAASPVVTWFLLPSESEVVLSSVHDTKSNNAISAGAATAISDSGPFDAGLPGAAGPIETSESTAGPITANIDVSNDSLQSRIRSVLQPWLSVIVVGWLVGACLFALRPVLSCWTVWRLKRHGQSPVSETIVAAFERASQRADLKRTVAILESSLAQVPMVIGHLRPVILLPISVASSLPISQLEAILAHELAHIRRHDYLVNIVQTLIETIFFYHPAVWWLSSRIRIERENCCDDAAIAVTANRVAYGRALLALEDLRGASPTLALGSHGGSLANRIRRLFPTHSQAGLSGAGGLMSLAFAALVAGAGVWAVARADEPEKEQWGSEQNGVACRIVPVATSMDDEAIDMNQSVAEFTKPDDVTFAVELKNVGDKPVTVLGVRYSKDYAAMRGKLNANMFGPHLFEFQFTDSDGKPTPRAERRFPPDTQSMILDGASTHELNPNQSMKCLLRPTKFERSMDYRLGSGKYRVRVRYRGPSQAVLAKIREHWPDKPQLKAWAHEVTSNEVDFSIAPDPNARQPRLVWGPEKDGLQAAVEIRVPPNTAGHPNEPPGVLLKTPLMPVFHVKNVSDKPITFVSESPRQGDRVHVTNAAGEEAEVRDVWFSGWPIDVRWNLRPGDVAHLTVLTPSLNELDQPGYYSVYYTIRFNSRVQKDSDGNVIFPAPGDWKSELDTGTTLLFLRREPLKISPNGEIHGRLIDDDTGKSIRRATVACGAIINDSGRGGGAESVTDSAGNYRLLPPSPGIYNVWLKKHPRSSRATAAADDGILVEAGKIATSELRVVDGRHLGGKVVDEDGKPVKYIVVRCYSAARPQSGGVQSVRTREHGSFTFSLPPGRACVYVTEKVEQTEENPFGIGRQADAVLDVPRRGQLAPLTLILQRKQSVFGSNEWLKRSTPGTEILKHESASDVTGTVVGRDGKPIVDAMVFKIGGPIFKTNEKGEFRLESPKGTQFVMHAFHPGYHVWFGTPTAGDVLKIVLGEKRRQSDATGASTDR